MHKYLKPSNYWGFAVAKARLVRRIRLTWVVRRLARQLASAGVGRGVFLDVGSNVGQAYGYFSRIFLPTQFDFHLFEPNPNCARFLRERVLTEDSGAVLHEVAASDQAGEAEFWGVTPSRGGLFSQGGSLSPRHAENTYAGRPDAPIVVKTIDFPAMFDELTSGKPSVVMKIDIEGGEYAVLKAMMAQDQLKRINILFVEFHSKYVNEPLRGQYRVLEEQIIAHCKQVGTRLFLWD